MDFDKLRGRRVVLDAGVLADWGAAHLVEGSGLARTYDPRWADSFDAVASLEKRRCELTVSDDILREAREAIAERAGGPARATILELESRRVRPNQGRLDPRAKKALDEQVKKKLIQAKDRHVAELALGTDARGVLTTDDPLANGLNGHAVLSATVTAWHVSDAAASLVDSERPHRERALSG